MYGCRIPECCCNRTVIHDKRYCSIFTIHRCSGLSCVHSAKRQRSICTKRLDPREHQNCARIGNFNLLPKDNSHSSVGISHDLNKLITNLNNNKQETSEVQFEEYALRLNACDFASRSKSKTKPQRRNSASSSTRTTLIGQRIWTDVEPGEYSISDYEVSKKLTHLLRHGSLPRENDGAIELWRVKDNLQKHFLYCHHWSNEKWKKSMARGGGNKKRYQYCTDSSGAILHLRALQGHSGRSLIDPTVQDNVIIPDGSFQYIYHLGCAINLHSITNSGLIPGGQKLSNRQTVFFLLVDPMDKEHKDPDTIDLEARVLHNTCIQH